MKRKTPNVTLRSAVAVAVVLLLLVADQFLKIYVKTHFLLGEMRSMGTDWAYLYFVENKGMAFGLDVVGGTVLLCCFRIVAVAFLIYTMTRIVRKRFPLSFVLLMSMILAGAAGNIFDNLLYGVFFTESTCYDVAFPVGWNEGYGTFFTGKVVDMFYFPIIRTVYPDWIPVWGGQPFIFFSPIFNLADAAISCGAICIILFFRHSLQRTFLMFDRKRLTAHRS